MRGWALAVQIDARAVDALERIATSQLVIAAVMVLFALVALAVAGLVLAEFRAARRILQKAADSVDELKPQLLPLLDRVKSMSDDVAGMTDNVRRKVDDILHTLENVRRSVERGTAAAETRVQQFGAVLDVVQTEAEELLLDAAATAHGVHEAARTLREPERPARGHGRRTEEEALHERS